MKRFYFTLLVTLWIFSCHATITQINDMEKVFDYFKNADSKTLVIFDVDMVLIQPSDPVFQMANINIHSAVVKRIIKEVPVDKQMMFFCLMTTSSKPMLIDTRIPQFLQEIVSRGIPTMALTANLTGEFDTVKNMEKIRVEGLHSLGIDFSKTAPDSNTFLLDDLTAFRGNYPAYLNGILFTNGIEGSKGEAFLAFLEKTKISPNKIVFIDDQESNLINMEAAIQTLEPSIEYQGLHFLGALKYPSQQISENEFESQWKQLAAKATKLN